MSFLIIFALLPVMLFHNVIPAAAAPPGVLRFETLASSTSCSSPTDLFTIGFTGTTGAACISLADTSPTDVWLDYTLFNCSVNLFSEAGCASDSFVLNVPSNDGGTNCINVEAGFRALNVTCT